MHHPMRVTKTTDEIATKIRVGEFEILKQKSNSATKNNTILRTEVGFHIREPNSYNIWGQEMTYDHIRSAQGRLKIMAIGSRPKIL
jgi:hypothetical protein